MPIGFVTCGPGEAYVKSGWGFSEPQIITSGGFFVFSWFHSLNRLDLSLLTLDISTDHVYSAEGVPVSVHSTAQVKISKIPELLRNAACQLLGKTDAEIRELVDKTLEGHQRGVIGCLTVEEIMRDRNAFMQELRDSMIDDLSHLGLEIVSFTIRDVKDSVDYIHSLGLVKNAQTKRDARIGEAQAMRDQKVREAQALRLQMEGQYHNEINVVKALQSKDSQQAEFARQVNMSKKQVELAPELQKAKTNQALTAENMEIKVVEKKREVEIAIAEVSRREKQLRSQINSTADAEAYRIKQEVEGTCTTIRAQAEAEAVSLKRVGEAEANIIRAKGEAEAAQMQKKAEAWKKYSEGAFVEMYLDAIPAITHEITQPLMDSASIKFIGPDSNFSRVTRDVNIILAHHVPKVVEDLTGININERVIGMVQHS